MGSMNCGRKRMKESAGWKVKYYKGLGTSTGKEFKEYFKNKKNSDFYAYIRE